MGALAKISAARSAEFPKHEDENQGVNEGCLRARARIRALKTTLVGFAESWPGLPAVLVEQVIGPQRYHQVGKHLLGSQKIKARHPLALAFVHTNRLPTSEGDSSLLLVVAVITLRTAFRRFFGPVDMSYRH